MDFNKEIEELLAEDISSIEKYIGVIKEIENKMKESLRNNVILENMASFYRGDIMDSELKPKIFNTNRFEFESKNALVALRFACGREDENENKKSCT